MKIPFMNADSVNILTMAKRMETLEQRLTALEHTVVTTTTASTETTRSENESLAVESEDDNSAKLVTSVPDEAPGSTSKMLWSTVAAKSSKKDKTATVRSNVPSNASNKHTRPVASTQNQSGKKKPQKIFGCRQGELTNSNVKPAMTIIKKAVFHIDNLDPECTAETLTVYLNTNGVDVLSCFPSKSWLRGEKNKANAFRVCIPSAKRQQILDPQLWTEGIVIRDWQFKTINNGDEQSASETSHL
jgi:hypothetical protein